jgi:hypothetical protein
LTQNDSKLQELQSGVTVTLFTVSFTVASHFLTSLGDPTIHAKSLKDGTHASPARAITLEKRHPTDHKNFKMVTTTLFKEHKEDDIWPARELGAAGQSQNNKRVNLVTTLIGNCICAPFPLHVQEGLSLSAQFVELQGLQYIGLGALSDELSAKERVYDTLEQLTTRTERLISIGYLSAKQSSNAASPKLVTKSTKTVPLDVWAKNYPEAPLHNMSSHVRTIVDHTKVRRYNESIDEN